MKHDLQQFYAAKRRPKAQLTIDEMRQLIAAYSGPIIKLPTGFAVGYTPINQWRRM